MPCMQVITTAPLPFRYELLLRVFEALRRVRSHGLSHRWLWDPFLDSNALSAAEKLGRYSMVEQYMRCMIASLIRELWRS